MSWPILPQASITHITRQVVSAFFFFAHSSSVGQWSDNVWACM